MVHKSAAFRVERKSHPLVLHGRMRAFPPRCRRNVLATVVTSNKGSAAVRMGNRAVLRRCHRGARTVGPPVAKAAAIQ